MKRDIFKGITLMNMLLCFCVVMIHLTSSPLAVLSQGSFWHVTVFTVNKLLCFSVPAFIFLSGFKLYSKYGDSRVDLKNFFMRRLKKIVVPYLICVLICFFYLFMKKWVSIKDLPQYIFLGTLVAHFYYVVIAVQLYLIFPVLKNIFNKHIVLVTVASLICTICFLEFFSFNYSDRFAGTYIFYFVLGMVFAKYKCFEKNNKYWLASIVICIVAALIHLKFSYMAILEGYIYRRANIINIVYVTFSVVTIYGICIQLSEKCKGLYKFSQGFGNVSYNVYLYHILVMFILQYDIFPHFSLSAGEQFAISFVVVYSLIFIYSILKNRHISK